MADDSHQTATLVGGGTGKTGRRIVEGLTRQDRGVRVGSRSPGAALDWNDPAIWDRAAGCGRGQVSHDAEAVPGVWEAVARSPTARRVGRPAPGAAVGAG